MQQVLYSAKGVIVLFEAMRPTNPIPERLAPSGTAATLSTTFRFFAHVRNFVRYARRAIVALLVCAPMLFAARPKTPVRVFCIAAFEYLARCRRGTLGTSRRLAMAYACDFGALRDEFYDRQRLDRREYRALRRPLQGLAPRPATSRYIQQLRQAERNRPVPTEGGFKDIVEVIGYRTRVLEVSLAWLQEISGLREEPAKFHALVLVASLVQLADDLLDWKDDQACNRPSYVTAWLRDGEAPSHAVITRLHGQADELRSELFSAAREDAGAMPFALAGTLAWVFAIVLLKVRFPR